MTPAVVLRRGGAGLRVLRRAMTRSLTTRVVVFSVILGSTVVVGVVSFVIDEVAGGLVENRRQEALAESAAAVESVQTAFANSPDVDDRTSASTVLQDALQRIESTNGQFGFTLLRAPGNDNAVRVPLFGSPSLDDFTVPQELRDAVASGDTQQSQLVALPGGGPAVLVGSLVDLPPAGAHELYLVYPLDDQVQTLGLVKRAFLVGGLALILLVATTAWLLARLVAAPVRAAATTAELLAAGELDRRLPVRGEDEIARLATSFNSMARSLQNQITELESLSRVQQRFVSDVSHELRTPLTTVRMAADVLQDRLGSLSGTPADLNRSAELLGAEVTRFEQLLADLLEISRFDAGAAALDAAEAVDLLELTRSCVEDMRPLGDRFGVGLLVAGLGRGVEAGAFLARVDPRRISRIVRNLVSNAIEHSGGADVLVRVVAGERAVGIGVRDRGPGLAPEDRARVFDRFWRADPSRRRVVGGSGLGLAIAMEDARLHGGRLEVWSRPEEGAHFVLTLPRVPGDVISEVPVPLLPDDVATAGDGEPEAGSATGERPGNAAGGDGERGGASPVGAVAPGGRVGGGVS